MNLIKLILLSILNLSVNLSLISFTYAVNNNIKKWPSNSDNKPYFKDLNPNLTNNYNYNYIVDSLKSPLLSETTLSAMKKAIIKYKKILDLGGWPYIKSNLKRGENSVQVIKLRKRLYMGGDMPAVGGNIRIFDYNVDQAVKKFQLRHGLIANGIVSGNTLNELNVLVSERLHQIKLNIKRIKKAKNKIHNRLIVVNIPNMNVETVENGEIISRHNAVIGKIERQTPVIFSTLSQINFNPHWYVPVSIVHRDLIPKIIIDPSYIKYTGLRIYTKLGSKELDPKNIDFTSSEALNYAYVQDPSRDNSLGQIKLNFPNTHSIVMHDTASKNLFTHHYRAYSSGCIRIQNIHQIVNWILNNEKKWSIHQTLNILSNGNRKDLNLKNLVSVRIVYITSWVSSNGVVHFRKDIYKRDNLIN